MIVIDREWLTDGEPSPELIWEVLKQFDGERLRLNELKDYYDGEHHVCERWRGRGAPNYRLSHDLPGYIVAMTSGYLTGEPIQYTANGEWKGFPMLLDCLRRSAAGSVDSELAADAAIYGKGVEMYYADEKACRASVRRTRETLSWCTTTPWSTGLSSACCCLNGGTGIFSGQGSGSR